MEIKEIKSCLNLRDLGGGTGLGGRTVRKGRLIRSSKTDTLTPADAAALKALLGNVTIIDLRTEREAAEKPDVTLGGRYENIPLRPDVKKSVKYRFPTPLKTYAQKFPSMPQMYVDMLTTSYSLGQQRRIFSLIFDTVQKDGCALFHCTEGKDRTGIVAALLQLLLGVEREVILREYMASNACFQKRNRRYYILTVVGFLDVPYAKEFRTMYEAHPAMLQSLFSIVDGCGGIEAYFTGRLGFSQAEIEAFRESMLGETP